MTVLKRSEKTRGWADMRTEVAHDRMLHRGFVVTMVSLGFWNKVFLGHLSNSEPVKKISIVVFWVVALIVLWVVTNVSEEHIASIFRVITLKTTITIFTTVGN
jgi:hypothetical protein